MSPSPGHARVGLALGAGGPAGGAWTRGCFIALEEATGFEPSMSSELVGTSVGAFIAGRIERKNNASAATLAALIDLAAVPTPPSKSDRTLTILRIGIGRLICFVKPPGRADPVTWVQQIDPSSIARVVSARCRRGVRRVTPLAQSPDAAKEIAASGAVPVGAKPVVIDGAAHIDGAVLSVTNVDQIDPASVDVLVVIAPLVSTGQGGSALSRAGRRQLRCELGAAATTRTPVIVFAPPGDEYQRRQEHDHHQRVAEAFLKHPRHAW